MEIGSLNLMKKMNQRVILKIIHDKKAISRAKIAETANLAPSTVTAIVSELIDIDLIKETKKGKSRGGRRPILLELNNDGFYLIGFEWGAANIKSVLLNLNREVVDSRVIYLNSNDINDYIDNIKSIVNSYTKQVKTNKIFGIGVGMHGIVNSQKGELNFAPYFGWEDIPIKKILEEHLNHQIFVDNDVQMMSYAEKWEGKDNFVFIYNEYGIGSAIVFDKQVYHGNNWSAGEFGHMKIVEDGPRCICGSRGCINSLISLPEVISKYNPEYDRNTPFPILQKEWEKIIKKANNQNKKEMKLLENIGKYLGIGISNVINFINPEAIIIGGEFTKAENLLLPIIKRQIEKNALKSCRKNLQINTSSFRQLIGPIGAATRVLEEIFNFNQNNN